MRIWQQPISLDILTRSSLDTAVSHLGRSTQVWQIDMVNDAGEPSCVSRITMAIVAPK